MDQQHSWRGNVAGTAIIPETGRPLGVFTLTASRPVCAEAGWFGLVSFAMKGTLASPVSTIRRGIFVIDTSTSLSKGLGILAPIELDRIEMVGLSLPSGYPKSTAGA